MRPPAAPVLTIFTLIGSVASQHLLHHAGLAKGPLIIVRQGSSSSRSPGDIPTSTPGSAPSITATSSSTTLTTSTSFTPTRTSSSRTTSFEESISTSESSTTFSDTSTTSPSPSTSRSSMISRTSSSSSVALSDLTDTSLTFPTSFTSTFASASGDTSFTVTAVVSRPSNSTMNVGASNKNGFFANKGAVAGTFLVVGLFGTAFLLCAFLWILRKCRRHRNDQVYFDDEYKEFNRERGGATPEPTSPTPRDLNFNTPVPSSPAPNMIERLHGRDQHNQYPSYDHAQRQRESGDFDPYKVHGAAMYGHSDDQADFHAQGQQYSGAYAYEPQVQPQAIAGPSHSQQQSLDSLYQASPVLHEHQPQ